MVVTPQRNWTKNVKVITLSLAMTSLFFLARWSDMDRDTNRELHQPFRNSIPGISWDRLENLEDKPVWNVTIPKCVPGGQKGLYSFALKSKLKVHSNNNTDNSSKYFMEPPGPVTALASFPGSGNTWTRHLIEQLSGFYTGSIYNDTRLYENGLYGEFHSGGSVIVEKTHWTPNIHRYDRAILLVRSPYGTLLSELNRRLATHVGMMNDSVFSHPAWSNYTQCQMPGWKNFHQAWVRQFNKPMMLLRYEDLKNNMSSQLRRLADFLQLQITSSDIENVVKNAEGNFHRNSSYDYFAIYSNDMQTWINKTVSYTEQLFANKFDVNGYFSGEEGKQD